LTIQDIGSSTNYCVTVRFQGKALESLIHESLGECIASAREWLREYPEVSYEIEECVHEADGWVSMLGLVESGRLTAPSWRWEAPYRPSEVA
jgi:hypothetical protein